MATRSFIAIYKLGNLVVGAETYPGCCEPQCKTIQSIAFPKFTGIETGSKVVLELSSADLVVQTCDNGIKTIEGLVTSATQAIDAYGCKTAQFALTISYDDAQLVDPTTVLVYNADSIGSGNVLTITVLTPADQWFQKILECIDAVSLPINLATDVDGVLPVANGGTGVAALNNRLLKDSFVVEAAPVPHLLDTAGMVLVPGLTQAVTTVAGSIVRISVQLAVSMDALSTNAQFQVYEDGIAVGQLAREEAFHTSSAGEDIVTNLSLSLQPTAGAHTYEVRARTGATSAGDSFLGEGQMIIDHFTKAF